MKLLTEKELIWSPVVANNRMNRERQASGINSYEKELNFNPATYVFECLERYRQMKWLDLCCGKGNALLQSAIALASSKLRHLVTLKGIDLVDGFGPLPPNVSNLQWEVQSAARWEPGEKYNLITCVHGLHYIGDKLQVIKTACHALTEHGIFIGNLDIQNIKLPGNTNNRALKSWLLKNDIEYNTRRKIITCKGARNINVEWTYKGASDKAGPNYTGQEAVDSYYG